MTNPNSDLKSGYAGTNFASLGNQQLLPNLSGMNPSTLQPFLPGGMEPDAFNYSYYQVSYLIPKIRDEIIDFYYKDPGQQEHMKKLKQKYAAMKEEIEKLDKSTTFLFFHG